MRKLKEDIVLLEKLFPKKHSRFQILSASVDELSMKFITADNKGIIVTANIQENYPRQSPVWFSESDEPIVGTSLQHLTETDESTNILHQVHRLVSDLCAFYGIQTPCELPEIAPPARDDIDKGRGSDISDTTSEPIDGGMAGDVEDEDDEDEHEEEEEDEEAEGDTDFVEMVEEEPTSQQDIGVSKEGLDMLDKVSKVNRQQHLDGKVQGSVMEEKEVGKIKKKSPYQVACDFLSEIVLFGGQKDAIYKFFLESPEIPTACLSDVFVPNTIKQLTGMILSCSRVLSSSSSCSNMYLHEKLVHETSILSNFLVNKRDTINQDLIELRMNLLSSSNPVYEAATSSNDHVTEKKGKKKEDHTEARVCRHCHASLEGTSAEYKNHQNVCAQKNAKKKKNPTKK